MQPKGSLTETDLRSLLESAQSERATGTLTVRDGDRACTLYFLFGHLFHALSDGVTGDEAVRQALQWPDGSYDFDAKAKLPPDETVKSSIPELVEDTRAQAPGSAQDDAWPEPAPEPAAVAAESESNSVQHAEPVGWHTVHADTDPTPSLQTQEASPAPTPPSNQNHEPFSWPAVSSQAEAPQPRRSMKQRPQSRHTKEPVPVPAGTVMYDSLKTSFVDFPRLITTLEKEGYTGYVRLLTEEASGLIFFREGSALECVYDTGGEPLMGKPALTAFNEQVAQGQGVLDVVNLSPELVSGLYELTVAEPMYTELYASWVDMPALLNFLEGRRLTGSVTVRAKDATGVIILTEGELTGAYTTESRDVTREVNGVLDLGKDAEAMIEVKSASESGAPGRLEVEDVVGRSRNAAAVPTAPAPAPAPAPMPVTPAGASGPPATIDQSAPARTNSTHSVPFNEVQPSAIAPAAPPAPPPAEQRFEPEPQANRGFGPSTGTAGAADWDQVVADLQTMADESLGNRSRKVKDVLGAAERSQQGVMDAINQVPTISILFIDRSRLESLADEMRARVQSY